MHELTAAPDDIAAWRILKGQCLEDFCPHCRQNVLSGTHPFGDTLSAVTICSLQFGSAYIILFIFRAASELSAVSGLGISLCTPLHRWRDARQQRESCHITATASNSSSTREQPQLTPGPLSRHPSGTRTTSLVVWYRLEIVWIFRDEQYALVRVLATARAGEDKAYDLGCHISRRR